MHSIMCALWFDIVKGLERDIGYQHFQNLLVVVCFYMYIPMFVELAISGRLLHVYTNVCRISY